MSQLRLKLTQQEDRTITNKYCQVIVVDNKPDYHRLLEAADGSLRLEIGQSSKQSLPHRHFRTRLRSLVQMAKRHQLTHLVIDLDQFTLTNKPDYTESWKFKTAAEESLLANYSFTHYKKKKDQTNLQSLIFCSQNAKAQQTAFKRGIVIAEATNEARDVSNMSAADLTPSTLAQTAKKMLKGSTAKVKVYDEAALKKLKMNLLLAVGGGSEIATKLIVVEYWGAGKSTKSKLSKTQQPLVYIGKGITYDTGGLNVKPSGHMHDMHLDMSGGAAVLGAITAIARLKLKKNVIAIIPAAENAVSDRAMRAGDIIKAMNGSTVEVIHTDAEGRMVLADALTYSERYQPKMIVDVATLTGASLAALGQHASAVMTKNAELQSTITELAEKAGDYMWPLPLWDEYKQHLQSQRADIANIAPNFSRFGGAIEGGTFLAHFAPKNVPWAHIDIAPRMTSVASDKLAKGATGEPVRLLVSLAE